MATGGTDAQVRGLGEGQMQWLAPLELVDGSGAVVATFGINGSATFAGTMTANSTMDASGDVALTNTAITGTLAVSGAADLNGAADVAGDFSVATNKMTVASASGNTAIAGTLAVTGAASCAALTCAAIAGSGNVAIATNKFTVTAASGNTAVAGTLAVTGASTLTGAVTASGALSVGTLFKLAGIETGLTANAGGTQAAALALSATKAVHEVTVVGTDADSVILPAATGSGSTHVIKNSDAAQSLQLFAALTETIDNVASATGVAVAAGKSRIVIDVEAGKWFSLLGA